MTNSPDDQIDPWEPRLTRRVGAFAEQAVRPVDASAVAAAARAGARRQTFAGRVFGSTAAMGRLGVVLAGALVAAAAFGIYLNAGGGVGPSQTAGATESTPTEAPPTPAPPVAASPTAVPGPEACAADVLTGEITAWDGAAGNRIATITVHNGRKIDCYLPRYVALALVDSDGHALLVNQSVRQPAPLDFPGGADATTLVDMANYCGPDPTSALKIRLYLADQSSIELGAAGSLTFPPDAPPCNGPNQAGTIEMHEFQLKAGS